MMTEEEIQALERIAEYNPNGISAKSAAEIRRLQALVESQQETIHRLNDKLDAALGGEDPLE